MKTPKYQLLRVLLENKGFILFLLFFFSIRWSIADHYRVPSGSMLPTIEIGDHVLVNKMAFDIKIPFTDYVVAENEKPKRGDIIVFKYPKDPSINYVKRLIGLPGDYIEIVDGFIKINGKVTISSIDDLQIYVSKLNNFGTKFNGSPPAKPEVPKA